MQNEYDIKKVMEEIELQLITSMKRTLWSHKEDEKAKGFDWPQWQALKLKQFEDYKKANKEVLIALNIVMVQGIILLITVIWLLERQTKELI